MRHAGFAGCPEFGFSRTLWWGAGVECASGGFFFDPFLGGFVRYDFPVTGAGFITADGQSGGLLAYGRAEDFREAPKSAKPRTLLALEDGSEFAVTEYWLEGQELHYVTTYGGRNSIPVERINLQRTATDNAERGVEFVLRPRPAGSH